MLALLRYSLVFFLTLSGPVIAAEPIRIADPDKFSNQVVQTLSTSDIKAAAKMIADTIGKPDALNSLQNVLQIFDGKRFDFTRKVIDRQHEGALRQIIVYSFVEKLGFVYFRFNFKMTSSGWILAHFLFKDENNEIFPKDFVSP